MPLAQILHAAAFAAAKHQSQRRKDRAASPYINHPLAVAEVLSRHGVTDPVVIQAALLHDTIEDTETSREELEKEFGGQVTAVVLEVTDDKSLPKAARKRLQIEHAPGLSDAAKLVKIGDKICNARDVSENPPADWSVERRREYLEWTRQVVAGCRGVNVDLERAFDGLLAAAFGQLGL